jgi:hypothetical protein
MNMEKEVKELAESVDILRDNVHKLLGRNNDFTVKVINGKTTERLASELIGEIYVNLQHQKEETRRAVAELKRETPKTLWKNLGDTLFPLIQLLTLTGLIITMIKVFSD